MVNYDNAMLAWHLKVMLLINIVLSYQMDVQLSRRIGDEFSLSVLRVRRRLADVNRARTTAP